MKECISVNYCLCQNLRNTFIGASELRVQATSAVDEIFLKFVEQIELIREFNVNSAAFKRATKFTREEMLTNFIYRI